MIPKVSLIIPVYNAEKYLQECLDSAINQTLENIEIIIVNDGSTDNSLTICKRYSQKDSRIKLISQKNSGVAVARNIALQTATGEYIAFMDSDDYIDKNMLFDMYTKAKRDNADIVTCQFKHIQNDGTVKYQSDYIASEKDSYFRNLCSCFQIGYFF